jgi:hypothetical protein
MFLGASPVSSFGGSPGGSPSGIRDQYRSPQTCLIHPAHRLYRCAKIRFIHFTIINNIIK